VIFVADGLRAGSVTAEDAPTMYALRRQGVSFANSHALFPTFTTPNASAIATGHYLGDTGDFSNGLYIGYRLFNAGNFARLPATQIPFIESDSVLGDLDDHYEGNFIGEDSLLALARANGYGTAAVGKLGPVAIQDITQLAPRDAQFSVPQTIIIDDATGVDAPPLAADVIVALRRSGLPIVTPPRIQPAGDAITAGARNANASQQAYFIEATTRVVLPLLQQRGRPFLLVYWSRDPDGTQHNQGDSLNSLVPGINGVTSRAAVRNADDNLRQILDYLRADAALAANTDVFVTSDHGFATISKHDIDQQGRGTASGSAAKHYDDVPAGFLPPGFLAIDLADALHEPLYDPDSPARDAHGNPIYRLVVAGAAASAQQRQHPLLGNGIIGGSGRALEQTDADVLVAANGGSDLIYLPHADAAQARRLLGVLASLDYVGALFVDDQYGALPGALALTSIALEGSARLPRPSMVVSFRTFALDAQQTGLQDALQNAVLIADSSLQQGQGMHGSFGRDNTFNFMAAIGPDFKAHFRDPLPASNADITPTLLAVLGWTARARGGLLGRELDEALRSGAAATGPLEHCLAVSAPAADQRRTILEYQRFAGRLYADQAAFRPSSAHEHSGCETH
jgi:hypothetical protein